MRLEGLSKQELWIVKWQYRLLGHFNQALAIAITRADEKNIEKLRLGFLAAVATGNIEDMAKEMGIKLK